MSPRRSMAEVRRAQIIEAARRVVLRKGYHRATTHDIAVEARVSTGIPHHYFANLGEILLLTLEQVADTMRAAVAGEIDAASAPRAKLEAYVRGSSPFNPVIREGWIVWLEYWADAIRDPRLADFNAHRYAWWHDRLGEIVRDGIASGAFRPVVVDEFVHQLIGMVDGLSIQASLRDPAVSPIDFEALVNDFLGARLLAAEAAPPALAGHAAPRPGSASG